jgi:hypothetical protein
MDLLALIEKMSESKYIYIIERVVDWKRFYLYDIDEGEAHSSTVVWTPNIKQALAFPLEEEVEEIKSSYRSLNTSTIVRVGKDEKF